MKDFACAVEYGSVLTTSCLFFPHRYAQVCLSRIRKGTVIAVSRDGKFINGYQQKKSLFVCSYDRSLFKMVVRG